MTFIIDDKHTAQRVKNLKCFSRFQWSMINKMKFRQKTFLYLVRALFPQWNFFDRIAYDFELDYQLEHASWQTFCLDQKHEAIGLFISPKMNLALACSQLIEQLAYEVQDSTTVIHEHAVYKMICSMLKFHFPGNKIQFKIVAVDESERSDLFLSGWIS